jgi:hypothetical protein
MTEINEKANTLSEFNVYFNKEMDLFDTRFKSMVDMLGILDALVKSLFSSFLINCRKYLCSS